MTKFIAEIGVNHQGSLDKAKRMADAFAPYADIIKTQFCRPDQVYRRGSKSYNLFMENGLYLSDIAALSEHIKDLDRDFLVTCSCPVNLDEVYPLTTNDLGRGRIKIASEDVTNTGFLNHIGLHYLNKTPHPDIILSTGMSTLDEIRTAIRLLDPIDRIHREDDITLFYCVSRYPCPISLFDLSWLDRLRVIFGRPVGFSDHSWSIGPAIAAVVKGATYVEKHVTLDGDSGEPDGALSIKPLEFSTMVRICREIEQMKQDEQKSLITQEQWRLREQILKEKL